MAIDKTNTEGYPDPTAYQALTNIEQSVTRYRPIVFICSPYAGDIEQNTLRAQRYCRFAVISGYIPFAPHLLFPQFLTENDVEERELGIFFGTVFLGKCRELWVFGDTITSGMEREIKVARWKGIPIRYFVTGVPKKSNDFLGRGEITKRANFHNFVEVSEAEFISTSQEVCP